jgi:hypothetical protein
MLDPILNSLLTKSAVSLGPTTCCVTKRLADAAYCAACEPAGFCQRAVKGGEKLPDYVKRGIYELRRVGQRRRHIEAWNKGNSVKSMQWI